MLLTEDLDVTYRGFITTEDLLKVGMLILVVPTFFQEKRYDELFGNQRHS